jgi:hypothetical protein
MQLTRTILSASQSLRCVQPNILKMNYELRAGDEVMATLRFRSLMGTLATGESADGCWTFKRVGFLQASATVRSCGSDSDIAAFKHNTWSGGGTLIFIRWPHIPRDYQPLADKT